MDAPLGRDAQAYTPCYCKENAFFLARELVACGASRAAVVFLTSPPPRRFPIFHQRAGHFVCWDYHVIVVTFDASPGHQALVWDLDTTLPFPCPACDYVARALRPEELAGQADRRFRVVAAEEFLARFASDRSHMLLPDGRWAAAPPLYAPLVAADGCRMNLDSYLDVDADAADPADLDALWRALDSRRFGVVLSEAAWVQVMTSGGAVVG